MAGRISKSSIDWAKLGQMFSKAEQGEFLKFKAKSDGYLRKVLENPEKPPTIDFNLIKSKVADKKAVENLEKAYKALSVAFPKDNNFSQKIDAEEKEHIEKGRKLVERVKTETKEAYELKEKFDKMIPYDQMYPEEFILTFPDWSNTKQNTSFEPHLEKKPGLSLKERKETLKYVLDAEK